MKVLFLFYFILFLSLNIKFFFILLFHTVYSFFFLLKIQALQRGRQVLNFPSTSEVLFVLLYFFTSYKVHFTMLFNPSKEFIYIFLKTLIIKVK